MFIFRLNLLLLSCISCAQTAQTPPFAVLRSPGGDIEVTFRTMKNGQAAPERGQISYSIQFKGKPLYEPSAMRLDLQGQKPLGSEMRLAGVTPMSGEDVYSLVTGKVSAVRARYNAIRLDFEEEGQYFTRRLTVEARVYDDALAFRYLIPDQGASREFRLTNEHTEFRLSKDATAYALVLPNYRSMYESEYIKLPVSALSNQGGVASTVLLGLPLLLEVPGVAWTAITEAGVRDYSSMYLVNPSGSWTGHWFESRLAPSFTEPELAVTGALPHQSPWRVLMIGDTPGRLIESTVLTSLNPERAFQDTSWIKPGRAAWDWWSGSIGPDGKPAYTTATMKYFVDFAAQSGLEYMLVDAGWSRLDEITKINGPVDIPELVKYAAGKGVRIWIWLHWAALDRQIDEAFPIYEKWGVAGVKIDFMSRDDQEMMRFYHRVAAKAAQHHLMVDYHGSTKPSGLDRTYPNVMGYEAVLGLEQSKAGSRDNPDHHVMLPFTRMLTGRMDYTPGAFDNETRDQFEPRMQRPMAQGTRAHQLAMYVVYEAPFQMVSDSPAAYEGQAAFNFIKTVPATWDEIHVINGVPASTLRLRAAGAGNGSSAA